MELIKEILSEENLNEAIKRVKANKGAPGVDKMSVANFKEYFSCRFSNCLIQSSTDYLIQIETPSRLKWRCFL